ncbi:MAG: hypothetical protein OXP28_14010 [Gammaproteobacteria bacterium]|nr:hypothetical protein [Gammaproteobacteria bacterium]
MRSLFVLPVVALAASAFAAEDDIVFGLEDLTSKEDMLAKLAELDPDAEIQMTEELEAILDSIEAGDDIRLQSLLSEEAGMDIVLPSQVPHIDDHDHLNIVRERYPTDVVLNKMAPQRAALLRKKHGELLDDRQALLMAVNGMPDDEYEAAMEFLGKMHVPSATFEEVMSPEALEQVRIAMEKGWHDRPGPAMGSHLLSSVEALEEADGGGPRSTSLDLVTMDGKDGYSFKFPGYDRMEVYPKTELGGVLYVDKTTAVDVRYHGANQTIAGHPGSVTIGKHEDDVWVTAISFFDGRHIHNFVLERRLDVGPERDLFIRMVEDIVRGDID